MNATKAAVDSRVSEEARVRQYISGATARGKFRIVLDGDCGIGCDNCSTVLGPDLTLTTIKNLMRDGYRVETTSFFGFARRTTVSWGHS